MVVTSGANAGTYWYHFDALGSVVALSQYNTSLGYAEIKERYSYTAFGETMVTLNGSTDNPYRFTGRRWDDETSLYYYRARIYSPKLGRFLQPDPIGYSDGMNMYAYVGNNPIISTDPMGLATFREKAMSVLMAGPMDSYLAANIYGNIAAKWAENQANKIVPQRDNEQRFTTQRRRLIRNALQHAYWSSLLYCELPKNDATEILGAHEVWGENVKQKTIGGQTTNIDTVNTRIDWWNNAVGLRIASQANYDVSKLHGLILEALEDGTLIYTENQIRERLDYCK